MGYPHGRVEMYSGVWRHRSDVDIARGGVIDRCVCVDGMLDRTERPQWALTIAQCQNLPRCLLPIEPHRAECIGGCKPTERCAGYFRCFRKICDPLEIPVRCDGFDDAVCLVWLKTAHHAKTESDCRLRWNEKAVRKRLIGHRLRCNVGLRRLGEF